MFNFFKKNKPEIPKVISNTSLPKVTKKNCLTTFQQAQLFKFVDDVVGLDISNKSEATKNIAVHNFISNVIERTVKLKKIEEEQPGWVLLPGKLFESIDEKDKLQIIHLISPMQKLGVNYLKTITPDYDKLMTDIKEAKRMFAQYKEFADKGGHISQNREFIGEWIKTISDQWFGVAHFVYDLQNEMELLNHILK